jgi:hypothetical protein
MSKAPPIPPAGRTRRGGSAARQVRDKAELAAMEHHPEDRQHADQGRQANVRQNTRHQGYQQDR